MNDRIRAMYHAPYLAAFGLLAVTASAQPVTVEPIDLSFPGGPARGFFAEIDITDPGVEVVSTPGTFCGNACFVPLIPVNTWAAQNDVDLAINANFFASIGGGQGQLLGLSVTDGVLISNPRQVSGSFDPALGIRQDGTAFAGYIDPATAATLRTGIAGIGPGSGDSLAGTLLVDDGINLGASARVSPNTREPRTAVGVSQDGTRMFIAVVDGRQPGYSQGITLPQLADFLIGEGAWDAVALDGGGSSSFVYTDASGVTTTNSPSDGPFRPVANHLGFRFEDLPSGAGVSYGPRPIRGVWLRPISSDVLLDQWLSNLAEAGITDLFLETFYHGLATNDSDVFRDRFAHDELADTIVAAHKYGMRVHAWIETGYWGFGSSADYILDDNPEWLLIDVNGDSPVGDNPSQKFVNLAHPGVQQMLADYVAELAAVPGLEGIHIDYHRYPVDNSTTPSSPAPYSYDAFTMQQFTNAGFGFPLFTATQPGDPDWDAWVQFRRDGNSSAVQVMHDAINAVAPGQVFSAAIFASATTSSSQLSKMQDWPAWTNGGYMEVIIPMAYGPTQSSIRNDLNLAQGLAATTPIVAGLALTGTAPHPPVATQLDAVAQANLDGFVFFEGGYLAQTPAELASLRSWLDANAPFQPGDVDFDGLIDGRDIADFRAFFTGDPRPATGRTAQYDLDGSGVIDADDETELLSLFTRARYGVDGVVDQRDLDAFLASFTGPGSGDPVGAIINLHDLDADGDVDYDDQLIFHTLLTEDVGLDLDANRDGVFDIEDCHDQSRSPIDVDRDGLITQADTTLLIETYRLQDAADGL
ncbi:MAG: phosphodiester glycosidase family protein [Planctomycetota bacterium]